MKDFSIKYGDVVIKPLKNDGKIDSILDTKWTITEKKSSMKDGINTIGTIWFTKEPALGVTEIDFEVEDTATVRQMVDGIRGMVQWAFGGKTIYEVYCNAKTKDEKRIDLLERSGFVYRYGNREHEEYSVVKPQTSWLGLYIILGIVIGFMLGIVFNSMFMGFAIGIIVCGLMGGVLDAKAKNARINVTGEMEHVRRHSVTDISLEKTEEKNLVRENVLRMIKTDREDSEED